MIKETEYQTQLVKSFKNTGGGYGLKLSHKFMVGIPDLLLVYGGKVLILETKRGEWPKKATSLTFGVTKIQLHTLTALSMAGANVRMGLFTKPPRESPIFYLAPPSEACVVPLITIEREGFRRGKTETDWPVREMMECLI